MLDPKCVEKPQDICRPHSHACIRPQATGWKWNREPRRSLQGTRWGTATMTDTPTGITGPRLCVLHSGGRSPWFLLQTRPALSLQATQLRRQPNAKAKTYIKCEIFLGYFVNSFVCFSRVSFMEDKVNITELDPPASPSSPSPHVLFNYLI